MFAPANKNLANIFYISSGEKHAQYTLRNRFEYFVGESYCQSDVYMCNLGTNKERALAKALAVTNGAAVDFGNLSPLKPYGEADKEAAEARRIAQAERQAQYRARAAVWEKEAAERLSKREAEKALSKHVGAVGERLTVELECIRFVFLGEGKFGNRYIGIFRDADSNKFIFFGAAAASLPPENEKYIVTFTVKEHSVRDGEKQTIIMRPKRVK